MACVAQHVGASGCCVAYFLGGASDATAAVRVGPAPVAAQVPVAGTAAAAAAVADATAATVLQLSMLLPLLPLLLLLLDCTLPPTCTRCAAHPEPVAVAWRDVYLNLACLRHYAAHNTANYGRRQDSDGSRFWLIKERDRQLGRDVARLPLVYDSHSLVVSNTFKGEDTNGTTVVNTCHCNAGPHTIPRRGRRGGGRGRGHGALGCTEAYSDIPAYR